MLSIIKNSKLRKSFNAGSKEEFEAVNELYNDSKSKN